MEAPLSEDGPKGIQAQRGLSETPKLRRRSAADRSERIGGVEDADVAERPEHEQIAIAGDDERDLGGERGGKQKIVVGISAGGLCQRGRYDDPPGTKSWAGGRPSPRRRPSCRWPTTPMASSRTAGRAATLGTRATHALESAPFSRLVSVVMGT